MKQRLAIALVLGVISALVLSASAAAGPPWPKIEQGHELSCSGARAKLGVTVTWRRADRVGKHKGHAVALIRARNGRILSRKESSNVLRAVRSQSIAYRFRFPKAASAQLCKRGAKAETVASHGRTKSGAGPVDVYHVSREELGGKANANRSGEAAGQVDRDCRTRTMHASTRPGSRLDSCDLSGAALPGARLRFSDLFAADLSEANLARADLGSTILDDADFHNANLTDADLTRARLSDGDLSNANLSGAVLSNADLSGADLTGSDLTGADLTGANCAGARKPSGELYPTGTSGSGFGFVPC